MAEMSTRSSNFETQTDWEFRMADPNKPDPEEDSHIELGNNTVAAHLSPEDQKNFEEEVRKRGEHALLSRKAIDVVVAAAVTNSEDVAVRLAGNLITQMGVTTDTGSFETLKPDDQVRLINAASELTREVDRQAHDRTVTILQEEIAELKAQVTPETQQIADELKELRRENAALKQSLKFSSDTIHLLREDKNERDLRDWEDEQARIALAEQREQAGARYESKKTLRQKMSLGARSVSGYFMRSEEMRTN